MHAKYLSLLIALASVFTPALGQDQSTKIESIRAYYLTASKFERDGDWSAAENAWRHVLTLDDKDARAWTNLGVALNRQNKTNEALEAWRKAIELDPKLPGPHFNTGLTLTRQGDYTSAVSSLRKAISMESSNDGARRALAVALIGMQRFQEASREIAQLLFRFPEDAALLELASESFMRQRRYVEGAITLERRLKLPKQTSFLWAQYGDALDGSGRTTEAVEAYRKAVEMDPESTLLRYGLGYLYWKLYRYDDAERELLEVLRAAPKDPRASFTLGDLYLTRGDAQRALPLLEAAREGYPNEFDTRFALGRALLITGNTDGGIAELRAAVKLDETIADGHFHLGRALMKAGLQEEAKVELDIAKKLHDKRRDAESERFRKKLP